MIDRARRVSLYDAKSARDKIKYSLIAVTAPAALSQKYETHLQL